MKTKFFAIALMATVLFSACGKKEEVKAPVPAPQPQKVEQPKEAPKKVENILAASSLKEKSNYFYASKKFDKVKYAKQKLTFSSKGQTETFDIPKDIKVLGSRTDGRSVLVTAEVNKKITYLIFFKNPADAKKYRVLTSGKGVVPDTYVYVKAKKINAKELKK